MGEALRQTLNVMVLEVPREIKERTLVCKVDNQSLKAVIEKRLFKDISPQSHWKANILVAAAGGVLPKIGICEI